MIYDCLSVFSELDLLEIRLNVLKDVDKSIAAGLAIPVINGDPIM